MKKGTRSTRPHSKITIALLVGGIVPLRERGLGHLEIFDIERPYAADPGRVVGLHFAGNQIAGPNLEGGSGIGRNRRLALARNRGNCGHKIPPTKDALRPYSTMGLRADYGRAFGSDG